MSFYYFVVVATLSAWLVFAVSIMVATLFDLWKVKIIQRLTTGTLFVAGIGTIILSFLT